MFLEFRNTVLLRGVTRMKCKLPIQINSHKNHPISPESVRQTLPTPTGLCPAALDIVRLGPDIVQNSNFSPTASSLRELYKYLHTLQRLSCLATRVS
jgi:hypothetical protein